MFGFRNISVRNFFGGRAPAVAVKDMPRVSGLSGNAESYKKMVRQRAYGYIFIALAAKLASVDGEIKQSEKASICGIFGGNDAGEIITAALNDNMGFQHYVNRIMLFFPKNKKLFMDTVISLFHLAASDGPVNEKEVLFLRKVSNGFELPKAFFAECVRAFFMPLGKSPYTILSIASNTSADEVKRAYYNAVSAYHPDKFAGIDDDGVITAIANERLKIVNEAWFVIKRQRKLK